VLFNVTGGEDLGILEVYEAADIVSKQVDPDANIIVGAVIDPSYAAGEVKVTLIATGFDLNKTNTARSRSYPAQATSTGHLPAHTQPAQPVQRPTAQPQPQPQPRVAPTFNNADDLDIPPFLRNRNRGR
jgi:cell division protein FtsZ